MNSSERGALELEEQFGIPTISLRFSDGQRAVIAVDGRKVQRQFREYEARLAEIDDRLRGRKHRTL